MEEIWKAIEGYEGLYEVSNLGQVRSLSHEVPYRNGGVKMVKGKVLRQNTCRGYLKLELCKDGKPRQHQVHRLVAKAFVDGYFDGAQVNHKDECRSNNRADNLEWVTPRQNSLYGQRPEKVERAKLKPIEQYTKDGRYVKTYPSITAACEATGAIPSRISRIVGTRYRSAGFLWRFPEKSEG